MALWFGRQGFSWNPASSGSSAIRSNAPALRVPRTSATQGPRHADLVAFDGFTAVTKLRNSQLNDLDHIRHPLTVAILVLFQRRGVKRNIEQRRNVIILDRFGAESPNAAEQKSIRFCYWHDDPLARPRVV